MRSSVQGVRLRLDRGGHGIGGGHAECHRRQGAFGHRDLGPPQHRALLLGGKQLVAFGARGQIELDPPRREKQSGMLKPLSLGAVAPTLIGVRSVPQTLLSFT